MASIQPCSKPTKRRHERNNDLQTWTAARCNRLLRQISSRVAHLRQLVTDVSDANRPTKRAISTSDQQPTKKRIRHTYGPRSSRRTPLSDKDGNISTPPRAMRALGAMRPRLASSPAGFCCPTPVQPAAEHEYHIPRTCQDPPPAISKSRGRKSNLTDHATKLDSLSDHVAPSHLKLYQAILEWLEKLLQVTKEQIHEPGRKSLLGMCLRRVPDCLDEINAWDAMEAETLGLGSMWKTGEAATAIYGQLEAFGSHAEGWKPLKHLVRSHAIQLLSQATTEGLFAPDFVVLMAKTCARMSCAEEAERLLSACGNMTNPYRPTQGDVVDLATGGTCNRGLIDICTGDMRLPNLLPAVGRAISTQQLHIRDIPSKQRSIIWKTSLAALSETTVSHHGTRLLVLALQSLASSDCNGSWSAQEEKQRMLISVAAGVAAAAVSTNVRLEKRRHIHVLETAIIEVASCQGWSRKAQDCGLYVLAMARQLALDADKSAFRELRGQSVADLESLVTRSNLQALYHQTVAVTCSIAHACSRTIGKPSHEILEQLSTTLHQLTLPPWFSEGLRSEGAFVLAQKTKDLRDLAFAEKLSGLRHITQAAAKTMFSGWRWEAGISEWVLPSPSRSTSEKVVMPDSMQGDIGRMSLARHAEHQSQKGFMRIGVDANARPQGIDAFNARNHKKGPGTLQCKSRSVDAKGWSLEKMPGRATLRRTPRYKNLNTQLQDHDWEDDKLCRDGNARLDHDDPGCSFGTFSMQTSSSLLKCKEDKAQRGSEMIRHMIGASQNPERTANGAQGVGLMRMATATTSTARAERRQSTIAVPSMMRRASTGGNRTHRRRTTVSLSSLAVWPASDDWDELL